MSETMKSLLDAISLKLYATTTSMLYLIIPYDSAILFDNLPPTMLPVCSAMICSTLTEEIVWFSEEWTVYIFGLVSAWTRVLYPAEAGLIVVYRTTWQSVDVPGDTQEIPSEAVGNSLEMRSVHLVELTLTVRYYGIKGTEDVILRDV